MVCFGHQKRWPENLGYLVNERCLNWVCFFLSKPWGFCHEVPFKTNTVYLWQISSFGNIYGSPYTISNFLLLPFPFNYIYLLPFNYLWTVFYLFFVIWRSRISVQDVILGSFRLSTFQKLSQALKSAWKELTPPLKTKLTNWKISHFSIGHDIDSKSSCMVHLFHRVMISFRPGVYKR